MKFQGSHNWLINEKLKSEIRRMYVKMVGSEIVGCVNVDVLYQ
jgi:glutamate formiminotransferase